MIDDPVGRGEEKVDHAGQDNRGDKVRDINRGLGKSLEALPVQLVKHDCQEDRDREPENEAEGVQKEGVQKHSSAVITGKEFLEVLQTYPMASGDPEGCLVIPEGDLHTVHREITEDNKEGQGWKKQNPQLPVPPQGQGCPLLQAIPVRGGRYADTHPVTSFGCSVPFRPVVFRFSLSTIHPEKGRSENFAHR